MRTQRLCMDVIHYCLYSCSISDVKQENCNFFEALNSKWFFLGFDAHCIYAQGRAREVSPPRAYIYIETHVCQMSIQMIRAASRWKAYTLTLRYKIRNTKNQYGSKISNSVGLGLGSWLFPISYFLR